MGIVLTKEMVLNASVFTEMTMNEMCSVDGGDYLNVPVAGWAALTVIGCACPPVGITIGIVIIVVELFHAPAPSGQSTNPDYTPGNQP